METCLTSLCDHFPLTENELKTYSSLSFAYIGDAVFDLVIRTMIVSEGNTGVNNYHEETVNYVSAGAQTVLMEAVRPLLTSEEKAIYRRDKNAKPSSYAKNQSSHDYRIATAFETLVGYLYLSGQTERMMELIRAAIRTVKSNGGEEIS